MAFSILKEPRKVWGVLKEAATQWMDDNAFRSSAAVSYYAVFSLPPLLLIAIFIAGSVFGQQAVQGQLVNKLGNAVGGGSAQMLQKMIASASQSGRGTFAAIGGAVALAVAASGVFAELQQSMNTIWNIRVKPDASIKYTILNRVFAFAMIVVIGFLLLGSLVLSTAVSGFGGVLGGGVFVGYLLQAANFIVSFAVITVLFALIFKMLPDAKVDWNDVWLGAAFSSLLFTIGKLLIGIYLAHSGAGSAYGAAGSLVLILAWIYYSSLIMFFGAEFTQVYANRYGSHIRPVHYAETFEKKAA